MRLVLAWSLRYGAYALNVFCVGEVEIFVRIVTRMWMQGERAGGHGHSPQGHACAHEIDGKGHPVDAGCIFFFGTSYTMSSDFLVEMYIFGGGDELASRPLIDLPESFQAQQNMAVRPLDETEKALMASGKHDWLGGGLGALPTFSFGDIASGMPDLSVPKLEMPSLDGIRLNMPSMVMPELKMPGSVHFCAFVDILPRCQCPFVWNVTGVPARDRCRDAWNAAARDAQNRVFVLLEDGISAAENARNAIGRPQRGVQAAVDTRSTH